MVTQWISVAVNRPLMGLFDYISNETVTIGARVVVPFGRSELIGIVMHIYDEPQHNNYEIKAIKRILDPSAILNVELRQLLSYAARYYQHPVGEVVHAALPVLLRKGDANSRDLSRYYHLTAEGEQALNSGLGIKQKQVLSHLMTCGSASYKTLKKEYHVSTSWLNNIVQRGWIGVERRWEKPVADYCTIPPILSAEQHEVLSALSNQVGFSVHVLEGVTGSGKTEIYIQWLKQLLSEVEGQALLLVPEIGLVQTMAQALRARLDVTVVAHHSGISDKARLDSWQAIAAGDAQIIVGTRSAVFSPFRNLRAIIVDEEHDQAYKQQDGFRYHARDMAVVRARNNDVPILLGSATPSLESYHQLWQGRWHYHQLLKRVRAQAPAKVVMVNTNNGELVGGLEKRLIRAMRATLRDGKQVMLFLNRRGYAPVMHCKACGWRSECMACDATMTAHVDNQRLQCHHCGRWTPLPLQCPSCQRSDLLMVGMGTQRLEQAVNLHFPEAKVLRMDSDAFTTAKQFNEAINCIHAGKVDIVLGTQWLSKGHHFANLHLVAIVDVDQALFSADYRSEERLAQLLVQVAGRAGRESQGEIWLQTSQPQHPVFGVLHTPYHDQALRLYRQRQEAELPPHSVQAMLIAIHRDQARAKKALQWTHSGAMQALLGKEKLASRLLWLGPAPALMPRKDGKHRQHLLVQAPNRQVLQRCLPEINAWLQAQGKALGVRVMMDIDPQNCD